MAEPMTEAQGEKIISLLGDILQELKELNISNDFIQRDVTEMDHKLASVALTLDNIDAKD